MRLVNGYPCKSCADEELAKKGINPAHPKNGLSAEEPSVPPTNEDRRKQTELGVNRPEALGELGTRLNLLA